MTIGRFETQRRTTFPSTSQSEYGVVPQSYWRPTAEVKNSCISESRMLPPFFNCRDDNMNSKLELEQIAKQYEEEGYVVSRHPNNLPAFAAGFEPDLLAVRGRENVLIQVKK